MAERTAMADGNRADRGMTDEALLGRVLGVLDPGEREMAVIRRGGRIL